MNFREKNGSFCDKKQNQWRIFMKAYMFLADGVEEIEALTPVDVLRRAGIEIVTVSVMGRGDILGSHGIVVGADTLLENREAEEYLDADMIILPGGKKGTDLLLANRKLAEIIRLFDKSGKMLAAICAAPSIYGRMGLLMGKNATVYPGFEDFMIGADCTGESVVTDGRYTTAKGMGVSLQFALRLVNILSSKEKADELAEQLQMM